MKIVYITNGGLSQGEGLALLNLLKGLNRTLFNPVVVLPYRPDFIDELKKLNINYYVIDSFNCVRPPLGNVINYVMWLPRYLRMLFYNFIALLKFQKLVNKECPDIIHTNTGVIRYGASVAAKYSIPHVWHVREYQTLDFNWTPLGGLQKQKNLYSHGNNHCIAITKNVFTHFDLKATKDTVIYDGVFANNAVRYESSNKKKYFLFVGCLKKGKGIFDAIEAFDSIASKIAADIELWLVGVDEINIKSVISRTSCPDRIHYLGFRKDVYHLMSQALALLVPSYFEGFGFITAEAMFNKCLVIGRNTAGTKEQFDKGYEEYNSEIALRFDDIEGLKAHMLDIANGKLNTKVMSDLAYNTVLSNYTIENCVHRIQQFYHQIVK